MFVITESRPPSAGRMRDAGGDEHLRRAGRPHHHAEPRRLAGGGHDVVDVAARRYRAGSRAAGSRCATDGRPDARRGRAVVGLRRRPARSGGFEVGSPTRPGGRLMREIADVLAAPRTRRGSSRRGCEPAWSDFGVTLNAGTSNCACAIAGRSKVNRTAMREARTTAARQSSERRRLHLGLVLAEDVAHRAADLADRAAVGECGADRRAGGCRSRGRPRAAPRAGGRPAPGRGRP